MSVGCDGKIKTVIGLYYFYFAFGHLISIGAKISIWKCSGLKLIEMQSIFYHICYNCIYSRNYNFFNSSYHNKSRSKN